MECSGSRTGEKRGYEDSADDDGEDVRRQSKKPNVPALASVIVEALKVDSLQRLCSSLEPLFRRIVSEEVERALTKLGHPQLDGRRSSPLKIEGSKGRRLQLRFKSRMPHHVFTGGNVEGEQGAPIHVVLLDGNTGRIVQEGPESVMRLSVVVLEGDFNDESDNDWTREHFDIHEVKERDGKRPLLTGDTQVTLKEGVGTLGNLTFTDNSSWIRSRKFRLGVKVAPGICDGIRVREGKTEPFAVKDHRGELYKKHYPPALHDQVWRLDRIAKDGVLHKKLIAAEILTVEDFLRVLVRDPQKLRSILGSGMSNRMWENTVEHAKTCVLGGKIYVYYTDAIHNAGAVFNHIFELTGLITDGKFLPVESLSHNQKVSVDLLIKRAYENWNLVVEYDGKVLLNSLNSDKQGADNSPATGNICCTATDMCFHTSVQRQQCALSDPEIHFQNVSSQFSHQPTELPSTRLSPTVELALTTPALALRSNADHHSVGTTPLLGPNQPENWSHSLGGLGLEEISDKIRFRSSEMLENDEMQSLLKPSNVGVEVVEDDSFYAYSTLYEPRAGQGVTKECVRNSGKAFVSWLKLKAALRWGIFVRKRAAEKRAQLVELD